MERGENLDLPAVQTGYGSGALREALRKLWMAPGLGFHCNSEPDWASSEAHGPRPDD